jgi:hypothetical protein
VVVNVAVPWGVTHVPPEHCCDEQSSFAPHGVPPAQPGEHIGGAHALVVQSFDPQSLLDPQAVPSGQDGAHDGEAQSPIVQIPDPQSPTAPQA